MVSIKDHFIVAIGASAGGLEAIHEFFDHMTDSHTLSFVIIQHLSSDYKSLLVELVSRHTHMKVYEAENNLTIEKNCIYVIPNDKFLKIEKNKLVLEAKKNIQAPNNAIDTFFLSLANAKKNKAIAIVLSGTGTDGTRGVEAIKNNGGMVMVQEPATAKFDGMPNSAILAGTADHILKPADMPAEIISYIREPMLLRQQDIRESDLEEIFALIHETAGYDFHYYKLPTIVRRITRRMMQVQVEKLDEYIELLRKDNEERKLLGNDFLIGVTSFFRDREAYEILSERAISEIIGRKEDHSHIKVWVCACSTGEEAYSVAMAIDEALGESGKHIDVKIFATDVDEAAIEIAARGQYSADSVRNIDKEKLEKYFVPATNGFQVGQRIRKQIVFARHDVIRDPPFINNDLVCCRNMLIYISPHLQQKIFSLLLFSLNRNGYLFLGSSEHSNYIRDNVDEISSKWKIYRKVKDGRIASHYLASIAERASTSKLHRRPTTAEREPLEKRMPIWDALKEAFTADLHMAAFFIDRSFTIRDSVGNYERFLALPKKALELNLLSMVPQELYFVLSTEIKKTWKEDRAITLRNLRAKKDNTLVSWQVVIRPRDPYTLVVISEQEISETTVHEQVAQSEHRNREHEDYIVTLENELQEVRNNLDLAVEDLETTNEELQSSNEELLSANEELQSSNEELQSLNEELHTLNTEHQMKIKELVELNDDLNNYFRSTDIAQIFLDRKLNIRKFNRASSDMVNFIDSDVGRPLSHISNNIQYEKFQSDVERVLRNQEVVEKEVLLANGKNLLMRIMPYLNRDNVMNGLIITFVDITTITHLNNTIRAVLNSSPGVILAFDTVRKFNVIEDFRLQTANNAAADLLRKEASEMPGSSLKKDIPMLADPAVFEQLVRVAEGNIVLNRDLFVEQDQRWYTLIATRMPNGFVVTLSDITAKKRAEQKLRKNYLELITVKDNLKKANEQLEQKVTDRTRELTVSEERFRLVARATNDALWDWDLVNNTIWWGDSYYKLFGFDSSSTPPDRNTWMGRIHPQDAQQVQNSLYEVINSHQTQWSREYRFCKENGQYAQVLDRGYVLHDEFGTPYRMLGAMFDVTELKVAEHRLANMNEELEHKVIERTRELEQINMALERSNTDLQQFASVASHDLQEPLRKIQMFSKLIQEIFEDDPANDAVRYVDKIIHSANRMRSLITDILNYSRLSASDSTFHFTDLRELIQGTLDDFELTIKEKSATIRLGELPVLQIIPGQIRQVFQNLIGNSLKFSKPSVPPEITITSETIAKRSFMSMPQINGPYHAIRIVDNGIGFDPQFATNIFNLFQRLHSKDKFEGTGIGLAITKKIIEKHHGLIRADSRENEGASFTIILPAMQPD